MEERELLHTDGLSVGYHGKELIKEIGISLKRGEIVTLIGPNGAGKSTILKTIAKQLQEIRGSVYVENTSLCELPEKELAKKMSIVFTERITPELMTVADVVAMGRYPYTGGLGILTPRDEAVVSQCMEQIRISPLKGRNFMSLSDGQKQRVLLAKALCQEPEILILDEPTSYLDVKYKLEFLSMLQEMTRKKKIGVLMSLHELDLAERVSDKIVCVKGENIEHYGTPEEVFTDGFVDQLYEITDGTFQEKNGCVELKKCEGIPEVFVIAGNGTGSFLFRQLQRNGIPFAVGILGKNDIDYPAAEALAVQVIAAEAYQDFERQHYEEAKQVMCACGKVICCQTVFGSQNGLNRQLLQEAEDCGMEIELWQK
uniref:ABC transporter ATP-binding protein n=1 Tax=Roseburia inulinivorans TaxID=360807 RepID=UPI0040273AF1